MSQTKAQLAPDIEAKTTSFREHPLIKPWRMNADAARPHRQYANDAGCGCGPVRDETERSGSGV